MFSKNTSLDSEMFAVSCIVTGCHSAASSKTQLTEPPVNISQSCIFRQTTMAAHCCQKPNASTVTINMLSIFITPFVRKFSNDFVILIWKQVHKVRILFEKRQSNLKSIWYIK